MTQDITATDMFCGAGGSTTGAVLAGADVRLAINHWNRAIETHNPNYQAVILENVVDIHLWRPFQSWLHAWRSLGYEVELISLNSMFAHPTPQSRDRLYVVAWKRGNRAPDLTITPTAYCPSCHKQ